MYIAANNVYRSIDSVHIKVNNVYRSIDNVYVAVNECTYKSK